MEDVRTVGKLVRAKVFDNSSEDRADKVYITFQVGDDTHQWSATFGKHASEGANTRFNKVVEALGAPPWEDRLVGKEFPVVLGFSEYKGETEIKYINKPKTTFKPSDSMLEQVNSIVG